MCVIFVSSFSEPFQKACSGKKRLAFAKAGGSPRSRARSRPVLPSQEGLMRRDQDIAERSAGGRGHRPAGFCRKGLRRRRLLLLHKHRDRRRRDARLFSASISAFVSISAPRLTLIEDHARSHQLERFAADDVVRFRSQRHVQRNNRGFARERLRIGVFDTSFGWPSPETETDRRQAPSFQNRAGFPPTTRPILPVPTIPAVLPCRSKPTRPLSEKFRSCTRLFARGIFRLIARSNATACSATA